LHLYSPSLPTRRSADLQLDRHVGYLSAVISSCAGELGGLRAERDQHRSDLKAVRALLQQPSNAARIDLKERESDLFAVGAGPERDRKSTRLNSSHQTIS